MSAELSSPVIADGRVYLTACTGFEEKRLHVLCLDLKSGKQLWERQFWATGTTLCHPKTNMAAPTPATDGKRYTLASARGPKGLLVIFMCNHCPYVKAVLDRMIRDARDLQRMMTGDRVGGSVEFTVIRGGAISTVATQPVELESERA